MAGLDPIRFELIKNSLSAIVDEMALTVVRTAYSGCIKDVMDFSTAFCDARGEMVAQGLTLPVHLGSVPDAMGAILDAFRGDIRPGDVYALNDPFQGGMHLPDIFMVKPVFHDGDLAGYAVTVCHHTDVGGRVAGSNASDSTEIYQEGLRIPPLKLYEEGRPNRTLFSMIERNVRVPVRVLGDLRAQLAACTIGERGFLALLLRYGRAELEQYMAELLDYSERMVRAAIARWPDGTYRFTDYIDEDGFGTGPLPIVVTLTVEGDAATVDFTGTSPQVKGAINSTFSFTKSAVYLSVRCLMDPTIPNNAGFFRPIRVIAPPGTLVNMVLPGACAARGLTGFRMMDTVMGALARVAPERVFAAGEGGNTGITIGGYDQDRRPFIFVEFISCCWGGRPDKDGVDGITNLANNLCNTPAEIVEVEHPLRVEAYSFRPDSGGAGKFRGGLGIVRELRFLEEEAILQVRSDRRRFRPYGLDGGEPGTPSMSFLVRDGIETPLDAKVTMTIQRGDGFRHLMPGGGGHGDPLERDPQRVREDVGNEKVSIEAARTAYGVVFRDGQVDPEATAAERACLRAARAAGGGER